jgi:hypothetical protein
VLSWIGHLHGDGPKGAQAFGIRRAGEGILGLMFIGQPERAVGVNMDVTFVGKAGSLFKGDFGPGPQK